MKTSQLKFFPVILLALLSAACAYTPSQPAGTGPAAELIAQADTLQQSGDIHGAIARVERAVRLEPRNAHAWHRLATLHFASGDLNKAEQFARRSNQFAAGNRALIDANQQLLEEVSRFRN